jgi:hypothetical protein
MACTTFDRNGTPAAGPSRVETVASVGLSGRCYCLVTGGSGGGRLEGWVGKEDDGGGQRSGGLEAKAYAVSQRMEWSRRFPVVAISIWMRPRPFRSLSSSHCAGRRELSIIYSCLSFRSARAVQNELPLTPLSGSWLAVARAVSRAVGQPVMFSP